MHEAAVLPKGTFALFVVAVERYGVKFAVGSSGTLAKDFYLRFLAYCQHDLLKEALIFEPASSGIVATLAPGIQISGTVRKENGDPANMTVYLIPRVPRLQRPDLLRQTVTDADGHFALLGVAPGEYSLSSEIELRPVWRPATITAGREPVTPLDLVLKSDGCLASAP